MSWEPSALDGLVAAVISGVFGLAAARWGSRGGSAKRRDGRGSDKRRLADLEAKLRDAYEARIRDVAARSDALDRELSAVRAAKDAEIARLNRLLTQQRRGGGVQ